MSDSFSLRKIRLFLLFLLLFMVPAGARAGAGNGAEGTAGGVPSVVLLSIGFGEKFNDEKFINVNGLGVIGFLEFFGSDVWLTGGVYTNVNFIGDLIDRDEVGDKMDSGIAAPPEGWGIGPGLALGFTIGAIPSFDIHLLGTIGPSFALLTRYQYQDVSGVRTRVKIDELDGQIGYDYGGVAAVAYTGSNPWLRGLTLGVEGAYHENTFDRWHLGVSIGFSF